MRYLVAVVLSALLLWFAPHGTPVNKQVVHPASVTKTTAAKKTSAPNTNVQTQPEIKTAVQSVATPVAQPTTYASGCSAYDSIFRQYAWNVSVAEAICEAESGGNPYAVSSTYDYGLMQINHIHSGMVAGDLTRLYTPTVNIAVAWQIYSADGWGAWSTYLNLSYTRFL